MTKNIPNRFETIEAWIFPIILKSNENEIITVDLNRMMYARSIYWMAQLIGWGAYCGLIVIAVYANDPKKLNMDFLVGVTSLITFGIMVTHGQRAFFIKMGWLDFRLPPLVPRLILSSLICSILITAATFGIDYFMNLENKIKEPIEFTDLIVNVFSLMILVLFWNAIYFTYHFFQKSRKQEISNLALVASNRESELKNLRSQLNPHFLFNSLNSIRALVDLDPAKAKVSITTLSNLLRQSLILGRENTVPLESELQLSRSYLELEKIRFEERLRVSWQIDDALMKVQIPPFMLQMMVENSIKHGISNLKEGGDVIVSIRKNDAGITLEVRNSGSLGTEVDMGVGIRNIQRRLNLQYGNAATFEMHEEDGMVVAKIKFDHERI